jgi:DNA-binding transcriptional regulator YiaG
MTNTKRKSTVTPAQVAAARGARTQQQAADLLGVSLRQWRNYESGVTAIRERDFHLLTSTARQSA